MPRLAIDLSAGKPAVLTPVARVIVVSLAMAILPSCVVDRTGQSATEAYQREMAIQATRVQAVQSSLKDTARRLEQIEEVTRARGQDEIMRMESIDQVRAEVARLRGDLEVIQHEVGLDVEFSGKFQEDADYRLAYLETRAAALEEALGLQPPEPPDRRSADELATAMAQEQVAGSQDAQEAGGDDLSGVHTPDELFKLAEGHIAEQRNGAARAVLERFLNQFPDDAKVPEARYRIGQTWYNDGDYQTAILSFQEVLDRHGSSDWAPWAMLRQGQCFESMGQKDNAQLFYDDVVRLFPRTKAAKEAKALRSR